MDAILAIPPPPTLTLSTLSLSTPAYLSQAMRRAPTIPLRLDLHLSTTPPRPPTPLSLSQAMRRAVSHPDEVKAKGEAARRLMIEKYSPEVSVDGQVWTDGVVDFSSSWIKKKLLVLSIHTSAVHTF